ncbi:MerR family DNA-binding transcriptional regulator [Corynebacterium argentoratense]|nr:MerR family DNA-binding transcriptional regulator [Corynebacterium argentoratense]
MDLTIKDVADRTGLSAHTIRYYCDQGLGPFGSEGQQQSETV